MPFALKGMDNRLGSFGRSLMSMAFFTLGVSPSGATPRFSGSCGCRSRSPGAHFLTPQRAGNGRGILGKYVARRKRGNAADRLHPAFFASLFLAVGFHKNRPVF
jgi:hypothetical protein